MVDRVQPVGVRGPLIGLVEYAQGTLEVLGITLLDGKVVCLVLERPAHQILEQPECLVERTNQHLEEDEARQDWLVSLSHESKRLQQPRGAAQGGKQPHLRPEDNLAGDKEIFGVRQRPVPELVSQDGRDLLLGTLVNERVVQDDPLVAEEPIHVRV